MTVQREQFSQRLSGPGLIVAPGVYEMISLRLADRMNFDALYMTGYGTVASLLGLPDAGLATYTEMVGTRNHPGGCNTANGDQECINICTASI